MNSQTLLILLLVLSHVFPACADPLDEYVGKVMRDLHIPGLALAVVRNGKPVKLQGYGTANLELRVPVTRDTVFEIGSITKQVTAVAILMLCQEGKIRLDDEISKYFEGVPPAWKGITVRHLLTHSSGIPNYLALRDFPDIHRDGSSHEEITSLFFDRLQLEFQPGETWSYSNSGYLLLGNLIEKVSGRSYWDFLHDRIFAPASMDSARSSDPRLIIPFRAAGYRWNGDHFENRAALPENAYAAGSIVANIGDMARWDAALASDSLLDHAILESAFAPQRTRTGELGPFSYGFGWFAEQYHGHRLLSHDGGTPGFSSLINRFVDDGLTVIVLTNHGDRVIDHLGIDIAGFYIPGLARHRSPGPDPDSELSQKLRSALAGLFAGNIEPDLYTKPMQLFLTTATGKGLWSWLAEDGPVQSFTFSEKECTADACMLRYKAVQGTATRWYRFSVTPENRIAQITWW